MQVYRIAMAKWASKLSASGFPARWNSKGKYVLYTASTRALACLENVVHRSGEGLAANFRVMLIDIPDKIKIREINSQDLPINWFETGSYSDCQAIGNEWIEKNKFAVLKVPSAIVPKEFNYLINTHHREFKSIKLVSTELFSFDPRLKH